MLQLGPEPVMTVSPVVAQITACYMQKKYHQTAAIIAATQDMDVAEAIYNCVFRIVQPGCWIAFLKNDNLNHFLCYPQLLNIVKRVEIALKNSKDPLVVQSANKIFLTIVQNEEWCRTLSYRFFIDLVPLSKPLAVYIVSQPAFLLHLHYPHLSLLIAKLPALASHLIETVDSVIFDDEEHTELAIAMLKWLLVQDEKASSIMLSNGQFNDLLEQLFIEFEEDRVFALEVLKRPNLCQQWLKSDDAYVHPLLKPDHYRELGLYYVLFNEKLSLQYVRLAGSLLEQELFDLINKMELLKIQDVTENDATYTPAKEMASAPQHLQSNTISLLKDTPRNNV